MTHDEFVEACVKLMEESCFPANMREFREYASNSYATCKRLRVKKLKPALTVKRFKENITSKCGGASVAGSIELSRMLKRG